jgi:5-formyltetrahydrofolate cyclo-ligase
MVFESVVGEPDTDPLLESLRASGKQTALPEDAGLDPTWPDVIVVPGLAFTADGRRCGQGGGWYDRFLPGRRVDCMTIGVCFEPQLVDDLPTDEHDVILDAVITD